MLRSLAITNFRLLEHFEVRKLGRVNLIVGKNNSGKSTVLEALRIYAGNAERGVLQRIATSHNESALGEEAEANATADDLLPFEAFFSGRQFAQGRENTITIGEMAPDPNVLSVTYGFLVTEEAEVHASEDDVMKPRTRFITKPDWNDDSGVPCLRVTKSGRTFIIRVNQELPLRARANMRSHALAIPCSVIPTQFVSIDELADEWDKVALTDDQEVIKEALRIIAPEFEGLTFVRETHSRGLQRTARVKLATSGRPVPLNSLGDGVVRTLQLVLKLFPARGGFFLIDEFENGLHFSVQEKIWELLFRMAARLDIQVFATTHSWDCIESFARAARANTDVEGLLFRVGKSVRNSDRGRTIATVFDEEQLFGITQTDVEVR